MTLREVLIHFGEYSGVYSGLSSLSEWIQKQMLAFKLHLAAPLMSALCRVKWNHVFIFNLILKKSLFAQHSQAGYLLLLSCLFLRPS